MEGKVICAFSGVGKTFLVQKESNIVEVESCNLEHDTNFAINYVELIRKVIYNYQYVLVSTHECLRLELKRQQIPYYLVYPDISLEHEYIQRYLNRGNSFMFCRDIHQKWNDWIINMKNDSYGTHIVLGENQFLADVIEMI